MRITSLLILLSSLVFITCQSETESLDESTFGYDFFPLETGKSWTYMSDSIIFDNNGTKLDTFRSFVKEEVGDSFIDETGKTVFRLNRYFKREASDLWIRTNTWTACLEKTRAIRTEENIKFVKLVFPVKKSLRWDGNIFVDENIKIDIAGEKIEMYKNWKYRMEKIDTLIPFKNDMITAIKVNLVDENSIIDRRKVTEYYGKGIGLIGKEMIILDNDGSKPNEAWEKKAQKGFIHHLTLIDSK